MLLSNHRRRQLALAAGRLSDARQRGDGVYLREWRPEPAEAGSDGLVEPVLGWCRETLGGTRRPWGIVHFDLALAVAAGDGSRPRSLSLRRLGPDDLYPGDSLLAQLKHFFESDPGGVAHMAVALFSWGDAAHRALPQR